MTWPHFAAAAFTAFSASLVECVEALTIVLAVGVSRGWRAPLLGAGSGLAALVLLTFLCGPLLTQGLFPLAWLQIAIGVLLLLFGLRWLRKAVLRAAGFIPLHDEARIYEQEIRQMKQASKAGNAFDFMAFAVSLKAVLVEGVEVIFIVIAVGAAEVSFVPAGLGALAALVLIAMLGVALHRPLTRIPEDSLKFGVGVILTAFGTFWIGEGSGLNWPGDDLAIPALILFVLFGAVLTVWYLKKQNPAAPQ